MVKNTKGFSIFELLIAIVISIILMSAVYYTYTTFFMGIRSEQTSIEQEIEKIVGLELLRLDLEHLGYGIGKKSPNDYRLYDIDNNNHILIIRATLNNSNDNTIGWQICRKNYLVKREIEGTNNDFVYIDENGYVIDVKQNNGNCPFNNLYTYIGYPFDKNATGCDFNGTTFCTEITYYLSDTNLPKICNPNTYNLLRKVNNDTGRDPLLSCVADIKFTVDIDNNNDGKIDLRDIDDISSYSAENLRAYTRRINVYILYQEATKPNPNFEFKNYQTDSQGAYMELDGQKLYLPSNFKNYKWKIIKISVKPMSIIR